MPLLLMSWSSRQARRNARSEAEAASRRRRVGFELYPDVNLACNAAIFVNTALYSAYKHRKGGSHRWEEAPQDGVASMPTAAGSTASSRRAASPQHQDRDPRPNERTYADSEHALSFQ